MPTVLIGDDDPDHRELMSTAVRHRAELGARLDNLLLRGDRRRPCRAPPHTSLRAARGALRRPPATPAEQRIA